MKITAKNYFKTINKVGFENLPEVLKKSHLIMMTKTDEGKDWSIYDNDTEVKRVFDLAFEKLGEFIDDKGELSGIDGFNSAKEDAKSYQWLETDKLKMIYRLELDAELEGDGTPEDRKIRKTALEKELNKRDIKWLAQFRKMENKSDSKSSIRDAYNEAKFMEDFLSFGGRIVVKKEIKSFITELQKAIEEKKIRKHSPFASEIRIIQKEAVGFYNQPNNATKFPISQSLKKKLEKAVLAYFNSQTDQNSTDKIDPVELSGTPEKKESEILPSTEFAKQEFSCLGFTGKWLNLIGDPCAGFTAMVFGKPKMGKSYLAVDFAGYLAKTFGKVLYVAKEEKFGITFAKKLEDKNATHENLSISDSIPEDLSPYEFIFLDSTNSLNLSPEDLRNLKEKNPGKSFVYVFQTTKTGNFRGANTFQHDVDIVIEIPERGKAVQFGRFNQGGEMLIFDNESLPEAELAGIPDGKKGRYSIKKGISMATVNNPMHDKLLYWSSQKAESWEKVRAFEVPDTKLLDRLALVNEEDYPPIQTPTSDLPAELQKKIFILRKEGKYYFIDTQGYDYPRYVMELLNYHPQDEISEKQENEQNTSSKKLANKKPKKTGNKFNPEKYNDRSDDDNPVYLFSTTNTSILLEILKKEVDPVYLVRRELAKRGLDENGKWIGFKKAEEIHRIK